MADYESDIANAMQEVMKEENQAVRERERGIEADFDEDPDCDHQCTGNCRRVGCNCECGEFHQVPRHIKIEDDDVSTEVKIK